MVMDFQSVYGVIGFSTLPGYKSGLWLAPERWVNWPASRRPVDQG
jgi:hypothetical protein